ncbi:hypothetical protein BAUCODRAFT_526772 [Baudoinia panamericana UAMH 10762]|uniref:NmrA-like domain-containing protein n=1 Tax=Baudoinia panamericana (strain UAMH 10762) TaxID=717646 RepID=M2N8G6_BAUPA|nr:uncharacterized protein BAUCODRAFT_526772 [Baudoinia panamericana UAMH 10762]EMC95120.1 hypothetical protein BAUCODRAFT_526772 [Baudoinia panamericana UAMH 10762]
MTLTIVGASGKLGFATLNALLDHNLLPAHDITCTTSSDTGAQKLGSARLKGVQIKSVNWDDSAEVWESILSGCTNLFLISSARIDKDFNNAPPGHGRESDHYKALEAARKAGVKHVYYTSLAFANPSKSRVMKAHERSEEWLHNHAGSMQYTIIREGLYNESWPLYLGHYNLPNDDRTEVPVAGDSKISWTSIADLGLANAIILAAPSEEWAGKTFYLSQQKAHSLQDVAAMVSTAKGKEVKLKVVTKDEHVEYYVQQRQMPRPMVEWWADSYLALQDNECLIEDPTLEQLLAERGAKPQQMEDTVKQMLGS